MHLRLQISRLDLELGLELDERIVEQRFQLGEQGRQTGSRTRLVHAHGGLQLAQLLGDVGHSLLGSAHHGSQIDERIRVGRLVLIVHLHCCRRRLCLSLLQCLVLAQHLHVLNDAGRNRCADATRHREEAGRRRWRANRMDWERRL